MNPIQSILLAAVATVTLSSCVVADYPGGPPPITSVSATYGVYDTLPPTYSGEAYRYQNRYYYGGRYEQGRYSYQGRPYTNRYYHNGRYFYGGLNETHSSRGPQHSQQPHYRNEDRGRNYNRSYDRR